MRCTPSEQLTRRHGRWGAFESFLSRWRKTAWFQPAQEIIEELLVPSGVVVTILVFMFQAAIAGGILSSGPWAGRALTTGEISSIVAALTGDLSELAGCSLPADFRFWLASAH